MATLSRKDLNIKIKDKVFLEILKSEPLTENSKNFIDFKSKDYTDKMLEKHQSEKENYIM